MKNKLIGNCVFFGFRGFSKNAAGPLAAGEKRLCVLTSIVAKFKVLLPHIALKIILIFCTLLQGTKLFIVSARIEQLKKSRLSRKLRKYH